MSTLRDFVLALRRVGPLQLALRVAREVSADNVLTNAAAMAYAWVFAVFPMVIFLMSLVPYLPQRFRETTPEYVGKVMYEAGMVYAYVGPVQDALTSLMTKPHGGLLSFGLLLTLYAASGGMNTTMAALDTALDIDKPRKFFLKRVIAMTLTVVMGVCFMVVLVVMPLGSTATTLLTRYAHLLPDFLSAWVTTKTVLITTIVRYAIGLTIIQFMIGVLYTFGPSRRQRIRFFSPGALLTAIGWLITGFGLRYYFEHFNSYSTTYGAVAGMVIMLLVFYLDATIILIGAEFDNEIAKARYEDKPTDALVPSPSTPGEG